MKLGTCIFLLVIILVSFGYVISDDQQARRRLKETLAEIENLNSHIVQADQQLNSCREATQNNQQLISQQGNEIASLKSMISAKEGWSSPE
jgi:peptidoglycan hydrolase CwlO-like protein